MLAGKKTEVGEVTLGEVLILFLDKTGQDTLNRKKNIWPDIGLSWDQASVEWHHQILYVAKHDGP